MAHFRGCCMLLPAFSWNRSHRSARRHSQQGQPGKRGFRPRLETLEDRTLLTLQAALDFAAGSQPNAIVRGDFNQDGKLDVAVANYGDSSVSIMLGYGNGAFQAPVSFHTNNLAQGLTVG